MVPGRPPAAPSSCWTRTAGGGSRHAPPRGAPRPPALPPGPPAAPPAPPLPGPQGTLAEPVPIRTGDELGALARAFNNMNESLARGRELRQRMTADIAHQPPTPLRTAL